LLALLAAGCDLAGRPNPADRPAPLGQLQSFGALYGARCVGCHGADGDRGPGPPLNDALFLSIIPDAELRRVIAEGRVVTPGQRSPMPAFSRKKGGPLNDDEINILAEGIKARWGGPPPKGTPPPYLSTAKSGRGDKEKGQRLFVTACSSCHGGNGQGLRAGNGKINDPAFLALTSDQALRRFMITGLSRFGMPPYDGQMGRLPGFHALTSTEIDDLVAHLAGWRETSTSSNP
jgi:mono/diheme cytochrome c family protein